MPPKKTVIMSKAAFVKEHKHLIKLLNTGKQFVKEARDQSREMKRYF